MKTPDSNIRAGHSGLARIALCALLTGAVHAAIFRGDGALHATGFCRQGYLHRFNKSHPSVAMDGPWDRREIAFSRSVTPGACLRPGARTGPDTVRWKC